ncbi:SMI1/KNR4 family protein [Massilia sp. GER05]|uniref:SMI1/KNR4 family protein n=1 Tax=unclassified Massilia TaxID=2609279 RepID=UPI0039AFF07C
MDFNTVRDHLISLNVSPRAPATQHQLDAFEHRFRVNLPTDVKTNYSIMNGADDWTDSHTSWIRFWPIEEWTPTTPEFASDDVFKSLSSYVFVCADYAIECVFYVIDLDNAAPTFGHVYSLGATRAGLTATSFSEFIMKVAEDHGDLHSYG